MQRGFKGFARTPALPPPQFNIQWRWNNLVSMRQNYFILVGYLRKMRWNQQSEPPHLYIWNSIPETKDPPLKSEHSYFGILDLLSLWIRQHGRSKSLSVLRICDRYQPLMCWVIYLQKDAERFQSWLNTGDRRPFIVSVFDLFYCICFRHKHQYTKAKQKYTKTS